MGALHLVLILGGLARVPSSQPPDPIDPEDAADQAEADDHYRGSTLALSAADQDEVERFSEIAGTLVLAGVSAVRAWDVANAWLDENPTGYPEWVTARPPGERRTMPPPRMLELVSPPVPPKLRKCLFCGERKAFPEEFTRRGAAAPGGPRVSAQKCNGCFATHPGNYARPLFKPDKPEPGPRRCAFCSAVKAYPEDFRYPGRPHQVSTRKCTSCSEKGTGVELERALEAQNEDESDDEDDETSGALPAPAGGLRRVERGARPQGVASATIAPLPRQRSESPKPAEFLPTAPPKPTLAERRAAYLATQAQLAPAAAKAVERLVSLVAKPSLTKVEGVPRNASNPKPKEKEEGMTQQHTARDRIFERLMKHGPLSAKEIADATGLPAKTVASALVILRDQGQAVKDKGYAGPWSLTTKNGNGKGHHKAASENVSEAGPTSIPEPPGPLDEDKPLVKMLLKERSQLVSETAHRVQTIDALLSTYKSLAS